MGRKENVREKKRRSSERKVSVETLITVYLPILIGLLSAVYVGATYHYTRMWDREQSNIGSYQERLNVSVEWNSTDSDVTIKETSRTMSDEAIKLPNQRLTVNAATGGIRRVSAIFFRNGSCYANVKIDTSGTIPREDYAASEPVFVGEVLSLYAQERGPSSQDPTKASYYSSVFLLVEGYNGERLIFPTVFEFGVDESGTLTGEERVTEYDETDVVYLHNKEGSALCSFDEQTLIDYRDSIAELAS